MTPHHRHQRDIRVKLPVSAYDILHLPGSAILQRLLLPVPVSFEDKSYGLRILLTAGGGFPLRTLIPRTQLPQVESRKSVDKRDATV